MLLDVLACSQIMENPNIAISVVVEALNCRLLIVQDLTTVLSYSPHEIAMMYLDTRVLRNHSRRSHILGTQ
jgi:hypothetical protein